MEVNGTQAMSKYLSVRTAGQQSSRQSLNDEVAALRELVSVPIILERPSQTESALDDLFAVLRVALEEKLNAVDRHLHNRTEWIVDSIRIKLERVYSMIDTLSRIVSKTEIRPRDDLGEIGYIDPAATREAMLSSLGASSTLLQQLNDDLRLRTRSLDFELRELFSAKELVYRDAPTDDQLLAASLNNLRRRQSTPPVEDRYRLHASAPDTVIRPSLRKRRTQLVDAYNKFIPHQWLSETDRDLAIQDARTGVSPEEIAAKYHIKVRTAQVWVDRYGPIKPKRRKKKGTSRG